jgi:tetratricopeptide (TPR) repeat protein
MLHRKALECWTSGDFEEAERLNQRIIEIAPNWVVAYNQLGYIAMSRGRFVEAEEYFTSYRFVAPDQANPHDSLGELYLLLGRYDEAETSLLRSIEIKPDFWAAYEHLAMVRLMRSDFAGADQALAAAEAEGEMPDYWKSGISCYVRFAELAATRAYREIVDRFEVDGEPNPCFKGHSGGYVTATTHRAACIVGEWDVARQLEDQMAKLIEAVKRGDVQMEKADAEGLYAHMQGVRLAVSGDYEAALELFRAADERMTYMQAGVGLFKLYNRLFMVETLFAAGDDGKAHQLLSKVRTVNPSLVDEFEERGLKYLGLERRRAS